MTGCDPLNPYDPNNDLPLPCENLSNNNFDSIRVRNQTAQEGLRLMLPYEYHPYIGFDSNGFLDIERLKSSANSSTILPKSNIFEALVYLTENSVDLNVIISNGFRGITNQNPDGATYSWGTTTQDIQGITVVPGDVPISEVVVSGDPNTGNVFIKSGTESSLSRVAYILAHELLGHMYKYLKQEEYRHGNHDFESWISTIESEANRNWRMMKKWEKSNNNCNP